MAERMGMGPQEAKQKVAALRKIVLDTYDKEVKGLPFFTELRAGTLPKENLRF